jgi:hypothetical protein
MKTPIEGGKMVDAIFCGIRHEEVAGFCGILA